MSIGAWAIAAPAISGAAGAIEPTPPPRAVSPLRLTLRAPTGRAAAPLRLRATSSGRAAAQLRLAALPASVSDPAASSTWSLTVLLGGIDISARLTGPLVIEAEEDGARLADIQYRPLPGPVDPLTLIGVPVTVDVIVLGAQVRRFTGVVDTPELADETGVVTLRCTDNLQAVLDSMTTDQVDALTSGAVWSEAVLGEGLAGYERATARMSTLCASLSLDAFGAARVTPWAVSGAAVRTITRGHFLDGTMRPVFARLTALAPYIDIELSYRYPRLKVRAVDLAWEYGWGENYAWSHGLHRLPSDMVVEALDSAGWDVRSLVFDRYPVGWHQVGSGFRRYAPELCRGFRGLATARYVQQVEERYRIRVTNPFIPASGPLSGPLIDTFALSVDTDTDKWEDGPPASTTATSVLDYLPPSRWIDPYDVPEPTQPGETWLDLTDGDADGRAALRDAAQTLAARAVRRIQDSLRASGAEFTVPVDVACDLGQIWTVDTPTVRATGIVRSWRDEYDHDAGTATTAVSLAVSLVPVTPPGTFDLAQAAPDNTPLQAADLSAACGNWLGSVGGAAEIDGETMIGFFTNATMGPDFSRDAPVYPEHFTVEMPAIEGVTADLLEAPETLQTVSAGSAGGYMTLEVD